MYSFWLRTRRMFLCNFVQIYLSVPMNWEKIIKWNSIIFLFHSILPRKSTLKVRRSTKTRNTSAFALANKSLNSHGRQLWEVKQTCLIQKGTLEFPHNNNSRNIAAFFQDRSKLMESSMLCTLNIHLMQSEEHLLCKLYSVHRLCPRLHNQTFNTRNGTTRIKHSKNKDKHATFSGS